MEDRPTIEEAAARALTLSTVSKMPYVGFVLSPIIALIWGSDEQTVLTFDDVQTIATNTAKKVVLESNIEKASLAQQGMIRGFKAKLKRYYSTPEKPEDDERTRVYHDVELDMYAAWDDGTTLGNQIIPPEISIVSITAFAVMHLALLEYGVREGRPNDSGDAPTNPAWKKNWVTDYNAYLASPAPTGKRQMYMNVVNNLIQKIVDRYTINEWLQRPGHRDMIRNDHLIRESEITEPTKADWDYYQRSFVDQPTYLSFPEAYPKWKNTFYWKRYTGGHHTQYDGLTDSEEKRATLALRIHEHLKRKFTNQIDKRHLNDMTSFAYSHMYPAPTDAEALAIFQKKESAVDGTFERRQDSTVWIETSRKDRDLLLPEADTSIRGPNGEKIGRYYGWYPTNGLDLNLQPDPDGRVAQENRGWKDQHIKSTNLVADVYHTSVFVATMPEGSPKARLLMTSY